MGLYSISKYTNADPVHHLVWHFLAGSSVDDLDRDLSKMGLDDQDRDLSEMKLDVLDRDLSEMKLDDLDRDLSEAD